MLQFLAWVIIGAKVLELMLMPLLFGQERSKKTWEYTDWITALIGAFIVVPVALRVLGYI